MNRAARRRQEREAQKSPTYNINFKQLNALVDEELAKKTTQIRDEVRLATVRILSAVFMISLHDEFGFGRKRLNTLLEKVNNQFQCIDEGYVFIEDLMEWCEEYGVDIEWS